MIGEAWASYQGEVVPRDAPAVQRDECKRAFYAGAHAMYFAVLEAAAAAEEAVGESRLEALARELEDFLRLFKKREGV
jgi:hypothetical protein